MKHCLRYIILLLASLGAIELYSQTNLREIGILNPKASSKAENTTIVDPPHKEKIKEDTVYCFQTTKRHGWFEPLGLLTKEQAKHRSLSIMFTGKSEKGHWTKMESVNADGKHVNSGFSPYIAKIGSEKDSLVNKTWVEKLLGSCIFEFIADPSGENIIQERAYDKDYNLLYAYSRIPINSHQFIGSYKDVYGLPAEMREEPGYSYGTLVLITEDDYGFDKRVEYIDAQRNNKPNADGAFAEMFDYNEHGDLIMQYSVDSIGKRIKDNWGNCALKHTFGDNHVVKNSMYLNENLKPMRMPSIESGITYGTIKSEYRYDKYLRIEQQIFVTENDEKDTNAYGCHKIVLTYDSCGNQLTQIGYDLNGDLASMDASGNAKILYRYDDKGNCIEIQYIDKFEKPVSTEGYLCKIEYRYSDSNRLLSEKRWINESGYNKLDYSFEIIEFPEYTEEKTKWNDGTSKSICYDNKNREILTAFYDSIGNRDLNFDKTWSYKTTEYTDIDDHKLQYITCYYGKDMKLSQSRSLDFNRQVIICDSITKQLFFDNYKNDQLINTFSKKFNTDFSELIEESDNNVFDNVCRSGGEPNARFYKAKVKWTPYSDISYIVGVDEFGEPDYISTDDGSVYYYLRTTSAGTGQMSAENILIDQNDNQKLCDELPKVMSVEVIDSIAYGLGLRDNDVILQYGDYKPTFTNPLSKTNFKIQWAIHSVLDAAETKDMVVFRVEDAEAGKFGFVKIPALKGTPSQLGFIPHIRYLTERQRERISASMKDSGFSLPDSTYLPTDGHYAVVGYNEMYRKHRHLPYQSTITDASILLGALDSEHKHSWCGYDACDTNALPDIINLTIKNTDSTFPIPQYYFTTDGQNCIPADACGQLFDCYLTDTDFNKLNKLYYNVSTKINDRLQQSTSIDKSKLTGYWTMVSDSSKTMCPGGYLYFEKQGNMLGELTYYSIVPSEMTPENAGTPIFRITRIIDGKYRIGEKLLMFKPDNAFYPEFECISVQDAKADIDILTTQIADDFSKYSSWYINRMTYYYDISDCSLIKSVNKDSLVLSDRYGNDLYFVKTKGKPIAHTKPEFDSSLLTGIWTAEDNDMTITLDITENREVLLSLYGYQENLNLTDYNNDGEQTLSVWIHVPGRCLNKDKHLMFDFDFNSMSVDSQIEGVTLSDEISQQLNEQLKNEMSNYISDSFSLDDKSAVITSLTERELRFEGVSFSKQEQTKDCVVGSIYDNDGYLAKQGLSGGFIILKWCDWECTGSIEEFKCEFEKQRYNPKELILLPISTDENGNDKFGTPVRITAPSAKLGIEIKDISIKYNAYVMKIKTRWDMFRNRQ